MDPRRCFGDGHGLPGKPVDRVLCGWSDRTFGIAQRFNYRDIHGNLSRACGRADPTLEQIEGRIDVQNDFGNIDWIINKKLAQKEDHRIASQSGPIDIRLDDKALGEFEMKFTECGVLHLANKIDDFKSMMFTSTEGDVVRRYWHARSVPGESHGSMIRWRVSRHSGAWPMP